MNFLFYNYTDFKSLTRPLPLFQLSASNAMYYKIIGINNNVRCAIFTSQTLCVNSLVINFVVDSFSLYYHCCMIFVLVIYVFNYKSDDLNEYPRSLFQHVKLLIVSIIGKDNLALIYFCAHFFK